MNQDEIINSLNKVFTELFDEEIELSIETTADDVDDWDSLNHMNLILKIEEVFEVKFSNKQVAGLQNIGDLVSLIIEKKKS